MIRKSYTKTGRACRVTLELPAEVNASEAVVCGDFNDWSDTATPLKRRKDGAFSVSLSLKPGVYRFRYLLDGQRWENDWAADGYHRNSFGTEDSLMQV